MADYVAREWNNGDIVTAANLNNIEQGVAGVDIDLGYSCTEEWVTLTDESVTTSDDGDETFGRFAYSEPITADTIKVTFNGTEYECEKRVVPIAMGDLYVYGANTDTPTPEVDWSHYPFSIKSDLGLGGVIVNTLFTETAGTYQVKIEAFEKSVETSECFNMARGYSCIESVTNYVDETATFA